MLDWRKTNQSQLDRYRAVLLFGDICELVKMESNMPSQRTVVIAVDDSEHSESAFDFFLDNVYKEGDRIVLVHVPEYGDLLTTPSLLTDPNIVYGLLKESEEKTQELVEKYSVKMKGRQVSISCNVTMVIFHTLILYYIHVLGRVGVDNYIAVALCDYFKIFRSFFLLNNKAFLLATRKPFIFCDEIKCIVLL
ncbi:uncharacterized protein LOC123534277 [Mercenaria mercenaria]|uniref:uncharacterized protein LOC123534277 n=1 Tax=Mercenaria mercenaria TaxID=6596 RepID=UPI00234ECA59|nr:uncharacterized protein LOC123534277 [Mercenaria mercenaria]